MYKLSSYYYANARQELSYYSIGKSSEEIRNIIIDAHLNLDNDLIEIIDDTDDMDETHHNIEVTDEEDDLIISEVLNLDAEVFIKDLDELIEDSENNIEEECDIQNNEPENESEEDEDDIDWDPATEIDEIISSI